MKIKDWLDQHARLLDIVERLAYKAGWTIRLRRDEQRPYLQVDYDGTGAYGTEPWTGRKWMLSYHMTTTEIVNTALKAVLAAEEHETRELLTYQGVAVFNPHQSVDQLVLLAKQGALENDVRSNAMSGI